MVKVYLCHVSRPLSIYVYRTYRKSSPLFNIVGLAFSTDFELKNNTKFVGLQYNMRRELKENSV